MGSSFTSTKKKPVANPLELLRDAGDGIKKDLLQPMPSEIAQQLFGKGALQNRKFSGEITPGKPLETRKIFSGEASSEEKSQKLLVVERRLHQEDRLLVERRTAELRLEIRAIHEEIQKAAKATIELSEEIKIASFIAPVEYSEYELSRLEKLFESIKSYRKRIENAAVWLSTANRRAAKKNVWGAKYQKHGAKYLLSSEHYLQRSAG